jgi:hypothetical protein
MTDMTDESRTGIVSRDSVWGCRLRFHHEWHREVTEDGGRYRRCRKCGLVDDGTLNQSFDGWYMSNVPPSNKR